MSRNWIQPNQSNPTQSKSLCHPRRPITLPACPPTYKQAPTAILSRFYFCLGRINCPLSPYPAADRLPADDWPYTQLFIFWERLRRSSFCGVALWSAGCDRTSQRLLRTLINIDRSALFAFSLVRRHRHSFSDRPKKVSKRALTIFPLMRRTGGGRRKNRCLVYQSMLISRIHNHSHCLSHLLPPEKHHLGLRPRGHSYTLSICPNNLCKSSFIPRCLFCFL